VRLFAIIILGPYEMSPSFASKLRGERPKPR
jgi:hypothetical protein